MTRIDLTVPAPGVALLTAVTGEPRNFTNWAFYQLLADRLEEAAAAGARVAVVASGVEGYFFAHGNIRQLLAAFVDGEADGDPMSALRAQRLLDKGPLVSIAAVDGQAWGGGAELAWACDLRVASTASTFGQPEVIIGVATSGGIARITRLAGEAAAKRFVLDGDPVPAEEAYRMGLVHELTRPGEAIERAVAWAERLASYPPGSLTRIKEILVAGRDVALSDALRLETGRFLESFSDPGFVERARGVQARYDEGADSYTAFGITRT